ncbi:MAG: hypothetical protein ACRCV6_00760 [Formosimonas sp.]
MRIGRSLMLALLLVSNVGVVQAENDKVIMSNSDAARMLADRYAKKHGISTEAAHRELTEGGAFKEPEDARSHAAAAAPAPAPVRESTVYMAVAPVEQNTPAPAVTPLSGGNNPSVVNSNTARASVDAPAAHVVPTSPVTPTASTVATDTQQQVIEPNAALVPHHTTATAAALPESNDAQLVDKPSFMVAIEKQLLAGEMDIPWQWLALPALLFVLLLLRWFKKTPPQIIVARSAFSPESNKKLAPPVHWGNVSFYLPVVLDEHINQPPEVALKKNPSFALKKTAHDVSYIITPSTGKPR